MSQDSFSQSQYPPTYVTGWSDEQAVSQMEYRRLGCTDMHVSVVSFGAAHVSKNVCSIDDDTDQGLVSSIDAIRTAIRCGINLIDTSPYYGKGLSEVIVGKALKDVPRETYYIATKAGRRSDCTFDFSAKAIEQSVECSLKKLGLDYIDLVQIHDVEFGNLETILLEALPTLARLRDEQKKIRYIGITGYPLSLLKTIVERSSIRIDTVLSYCRLTLFDSELLDYLPFFESKKIGVINAAIFGMGLFSSQPIPYWHPASDAIRDACQRARVFCQDNGVSIAELALSYATNRSTLVHTHLLGMETTEMVHTNIDSVRRKCSDSEPKLIQHIIQEIFAKLPVHHWENVELERYRQDPDEFARFLSR